MVDNPFFTKWYQTIIIAAKRRGEGFKKRKLYKNF
jgi:hypothetical protein